MKKHARTIFRNAMLLTASSLLIRSVSVGFQVYLSARIGAEALGLYSLLSGVYGFALTLASAGIHLAVTRTVADALGRGEEARVPVLLRRAVFLAAGTGLFAAILLFSGARFIGTRWLKDIRTVPSLRLLSVTLPLFSVSAVMNGYFTAVRRVNRNALTQVLEQSLCILLTMRLLPLFFPFGIGGTCAALVLGGVLAQFGSFSVGLVLFLKDRKAHFSTSEGDGKAETARLSKISFPIAVTALLRSGLVTLEHILIPEGLRDSGSSHGEALAAYGTAHSMALPVVLYPAALISAFSGLLIPEIAEAAARGSQKRIRYMISRVWGLSSLYSIGVAGIFVCFAGEIGEILFPGTGAAEYIRLFAPLIPIMYVDTATDAMMKGLGEEIFSMNINIADALISVLLVWILIPRVGMKGYLIAVYFSETFNTVLSVTHLLSVSSAPTRLLKWVYKPLLAIIGATFAASKIPLPGATVEWWHLALHILPAVILYLLFLKVLRCADPDDLDWVASLFRREPSEKEFSELPALKRRRKRRAQE